MGWLKMDYCDIDNNYLEIWWQVGIGCGTDLAPNKVLRCERHVDFNVFANKWLE